MERYAAANFSSQEDFEKNFEIKVPENYNFVFDCLDVLAQEQTNKTAMVWCDEKGNEAVYSFGEMAFYADASARYFKSIGIKKGDAVMLVLKRRVQFWFALLGLIKLGAVTVPATHMMSKSDIVYRNNTAKIKAIVCVDEAELMQAIENAEKESSTLLHKIKLGEENRSGWVSFDKGIKANVQGEKLERVSENEDTMMIYFTSGTTGMPKMVSHNFAYPLGHIVTARYWHNVHSGSLHLTVADTGWAKAVWGKLFGQWLCEAAVFVYDHDYFDVNKLLEVMAKYKVTSFCAPPTIYRYIIRADLKAYDLSALEYVTTAGEPLNPEVSKQFKNATGLDIREAYGQTETTPIILTTPYMEPKFGCLGFPNPLYNVKLVDENGIEVGCDEEGEIIINANVGEIPGVFAGYYKDDELTKSVWSGGVYHTGDLAVKHENGYIEFVGRADDVIKASSYRIGPFEVESVLMEHPAVVECAVTGVPDAKRGQAVKASIILAGGYEPSQRLKTEIQQFVKDNTAAYKCPRIVEFVEELPKTISGKIKRAKIRTESN